MFLFFTINCRISWKHCNAIQHAHIAFFYYLRGHQTLITGIYKIYWTSLNFMHLILMNFPCGQKLQQNPPFLLVSWWGVMNTAASRGCQQTVASDSLLFFLAQSPDVQRYTDLTPWNSYWSCCGNDAEFNGAFHRESGKSSVVSTKLSSLKWNTLTCNQAKFPSFFLRLPSKGKQSGWAYNRWNSANIHVITST